MNIFYVILAVLAFSTSTYFVFTLLSDQIPFCLFPSIFPCSLKVYNGTIDLQKY